MAPNWTGSSAVTNGARLAFSHRIEAVVSVPLSQYASSASAAQLVIALLGFVPVLAGCFSVSSAGVYRGIPTTSKGITVDAAPRQPSWGVGVSSPLSLYSYDQRIAPKTTPEYCRTQDLFLLEMKRRINAPTADSRDCSASTTLETDGGTTLRIRCSMRKTATGCEDVYSASVWTEQATSSLANFSARSYAWVRRRCPVGATVGGNVYDVSDDNDIVSLAGTPASLWKAFVASCQSSMEGHP
jgi:hypothetical protein